jgi:hypothetical protein
VTRTAPTPAQAERFWSRVDRSAGPEACWPWTGSKASHGYGTLTIARVSWTSHRAAWVIEKGLIPDGRFVCHRCDNRLCCNPAHLFLGTHTDNMQDMVSKGRHGSTIHPENRPRGAAHFARRRPDLVLRGARHGQAKLDNSKVRNIRELLEKSSDRIVARIVGVSRTTVRAIRRGERWAEVA